MKKALASIIVNAVLITAAQAQPQRLLTLKEAVDAALQNNRLITIAKTNEQIAASRYKQTDAIYLPQAAFSYSVLSTNNPLNAFGFKLQQKEIGMQDFNPALLNNPKSRPDFTTKIELQQPLLNLDLLYKRKAAARQVEMYALGTERTRQHLAFEVQKAYLQLQLAYEVKTLLQTALQTATAFEKVSVDYFNEGLLQKSDLLNAKLHVKSIETRIAETENNIREASDMLSWLMNKPSDIVFTVEPQQPILAGADSALTNMNRADLTALRKGIESMDMAIASTRKSVLPRVNAFASYQYNNQAMFDYNDGAYLAGIQLSWDIFKGNSTRNKVVEQNLEKQKMQQQLQQQVDLSQLQINQAKRSAQNAGFKIQQYKQAVQQAEEAQRITRSRFEQGLMKSADVLAAQTQLSQQQLFLAEAIYQHNQAIYHIQFLTSTVK